MQKASAVFPYGLASAGLPTYTHNNNYTHTHTHKKKWAGKHAHTVVQVRKPPSMQLEKAVWSQVATSLHLKDCLILWEFALCFVVSVR